MNSEARIPQPERRSALVCFAVKEEAEAFQRQSARGPWLKVLVTGMGAANAEKAIRKAVAEARPGLVLTCGFAGGLDPALTAGTVLFETEAGSGLEPVLLAAGARRGRFHCLGRVAATAPEKRSLREATGADAVEMESQIIRAVCREQRIPCATVRVVLDTAREDLALDFNRLLTPDWRLNYVKLAAELVKAPGKIGELRKLQQQGKAAAEELARVLVRAIGSRLVTPE